MRVTAAAGMSASAAFVAGFTAEGLLRPDYDPWSRFVSELAIGPLGWAQDADFLLTGLLVELFAFGLRRRLAAGSLANATFIVFVVLGLGLTASAFFTTDASTPSAQATAHGRVHGVLGAIVFLCMPVSCLLVWRLLARVEPAAAFRRWTLATGASLLTGIVALKVAEVPALVLFEWRGLVQRVDLIVYFAWLFALALQIARGTGRSMRPRSPDR